MIGTVGMVEGGCFVRGMSDRERWAWARALFLATRQDSPDDAEDAMCTAANAAEERSIIMEKRGRHDDAHDWWRVSELFDAAVKGLL